MLTYIFPQIDNCLSHLYIMAFTSGASGAGSDSGHAVEVQLTSGQVQSLPLYDRPGNDMLEHKGDLWKISFTDFHFFDGCITIQEISGVAMKQNSNDGWQIDSIVTFVKDVYGGSQLLTQNLDAFRWIDGDGAYSSRRFPLTLVA